jgi:predicted nucleic acid-binding protein
MNGYILDSSFLSAFFNESDVNHSKAKDIVKRMNRVLPILIPSVVFAEISRIPVKSLRERVVYNCLNIVDMVVYLEDTLLEEYLDFSKRMTLRSTAIDSMLLFFSFFYGCKLVTFDKGLRRLV